MSAQHAHKDRHQMWTELGDAWETAQGYLAMLALTVIVTGGAALFGLALAEAASNAPALTFSTLTGLGLVALIGWRWRVAGRKANADKRVDNIATARARVARSLALVDAPPGYLEVYDRHVCAYVCSKCGAPVAADPCPVHGPAATDAGVQL